MLHAPRSTRLDRLTPLFALLLLVVGTSACDSDTRSDGTEGDGSAAWPLAYAVENTGADCPEPPLPFIDELPAVAALPNPFEWSDGSGTIAIRTDWRCRRAEIGTEIQRYELGYKPAAPTRFETSLSGDTLLTMRVEEDGAALTLTARLTLPAAEEPLPAVIGVGFGATGSLPPDLFAERAVATVQFNFAEIADVYSDRGADRFYQLYSTDIGKYAAWAWGISRIIDGLEATPELGIDLSRLAVTGCSFAGKIALFTGALDERIALTITQEPGGGGAAAWRVTEALEGERETLARTTASWYRPGFLDFGDEVDKLPYDHHELMAMVAPRALLVLGNPDYEWLAEESSHVSNMAAREVWEALGAPERFGFSIVDGHDHCVLPDSQRAEVEAFVDRFLLGDDRANTDVSTTPYATSLSRWIPWQTPDLE